MILTGIVHVISRQTIASDSISITSPQITVSAESALSEIGLCGIEATRDVIISTKSSIYSKGIVTEHSSP